MDVPHSDLQRRLGPTQVAMMGLGGSLGTGLFLGSGDVLRLTGSGAVLSYALTAALAVVVMYAMGEVTAAHPELGGFGAVAHDYLGLRVKMCVWLGVSRGLDLAFLNAD